MVILYPRVKNSINPLNNTVDVYYFSRFLVVNVDKRRVFGSMSPHGEEGDSKQMSQSRKHDILRGFIRNVVGPIFPDIYVPNPYSVDPNTGGM